MAYRSDRARRLDFADVEGEFLSALGAASLAPHGGETIPADGKLHRFRLHDDKPGRKNGWATLHADGAPNGTAGSWRTGERIEWHPEGARLTVAERNRLVEARRKREAEHAAMQARAGKKAAALWERLPAAPGDHVYLARKKVPPGPCRVTRTGALVLPVTDARTGEMVSLQFIRADGEKRFLTGGRTAGGCCVLGDIAGDGPLAIAEGYATGASIRVATGWPVALAFSAGNLKAVAEAFRARFPDRVLVIAGDNDIETPGNPGVTKGTEAARAVNARLVVPPEPGDFNDYVIERGADAMRAIFDVAEPPAATGETDDQAIARLAALPPLQYDRGREAEAKRLNVRVGTLDKLVARARGDEAEDDGAQGSPLPFEDLEPWPEPVDGAALLDSLAATFARFLVLPEGAAEALALWTMHAHAHDAAQISPVLALTSPEKRCGKTRCLDILQALTPRSLHTANITAASLFRAVEKWAPTVLIDEGDTFLRDNDELRGILNSGHSRTSAIVLRTVGDDHEARVFRTWAPKAIALIGGLPDTLHDRAVVVRLKRKAPGERVERLRLDRVDALKALARQAARWASDNLDALRAADPEVPGELHDRAADNWRPLLAIADRAGGEWPKRARHVARLLSGGDDAGEDSARVMLLADIRGILENRESDRITSGELVGVLAAMEDRPWPEWKRGKPITPRQLAKLLAPFGIAPKTVRTVGERAKGYVAEDFRDVFARYLPSDPCQRDNLRETAKNAGFRSVTKEGVSRIENGANAKDSAPCHGVTDRNPPSGGEGGVEAEEGAL